MTPTKRTVRVYIEMSIDIDADAWLDYYDEDLTENQRDARNYIENVVRQQLQDVGVLA